jgi:sucrose phosphorylase
MGPDGRKFIRSLERIYGDRAAEAVGLVFGVLDRHQAEFATESRPRTARPARFTQKDALLISYGDMIAPDATAAPKPGAVPQAGGSALSRLSGFMEAYLSGLFSYLHILPFYPYSSDDGFSVMDYRAVDTALGTWRDVETLGRSRRLAFDLVLNHASAQGVWFKSFKAGVAPYDRFFITRPLEYDSRTVLRPRTHPLITPVQLDDGRTVGIWTTFSQDQVDLDFSEPAVLAEFIDIILSYAAHGARMLRLDAIAYLWKRDGTSCAHLSETHELVQALRAMIDGLDLDLVLLTETNVPHNENLSYFGDGDEAHMVYNFSLPPLTLHAFVTGDAGPLSRWAAGLRVPEGGTMLNFLASHDGIGVTPARGLVDNFDTTIQAVRDRGGLVSYKATPDGPVPYELNVSWVDAIARTGADDDERSRALIASYAVACAMDGVPAIYFHSLVGSRNWTEGPGLLGHNRAINRQRPSHSELEASLGDPYSLRARTLAGFSSLLQERARRPAFSPSAPRKAFALDGPVFLLERGSGATAVLVAINCSHLAASFTLPETWHAAVRGLDPVSGRSAGLDATKKTITMAGYGVLWIEGSR